MTHKIEYLWAFGVRIPNTCSKQGMTRFASIDYLEKIDQAIHFLFQPK